MNILKRLALVTAVALVPAFAFAQTTPAPGASPGATSPKAKGERGERKGGQRGERFKKADTNNDGALSKAEVDAAGMKGLSKNFDKIDANKDGKITREEMKAAREARKGERNGKGERRAKPDRGATPATPATPAAPATK